MSLLDQTMAGLATITEAEVTALPPRLRLRFACLCKHWARVADPDTKTADQIMQDAREATRPCRSGVLAELRHDATD